MNFIPDQPPGTDLETTLRAVRSLVKAQLVALYQRQSDPPHKLLCVPPQRESQEKFLEFCQSLMAGDEPALMLEANDAFELAFHDWQDKTESVESYLSLLLEPHPERQAPSSLLCLFYSEPGGFSNLDGETLSNIRQWLSREAGSPVPKPKTQP